MKHLILMAVAGAFLLDLAMPVRAGTIQTECQALFQKADENRDGVLAGGETNPFAKPLGASSSLSQIGTAVSEEEFMTQCGASVLQQMPATQLAMMLLLVSASARATDLLAPE